MTQGIPADIWRMPANFPVEETARGSRSPGMLTPAVDSAYGQCSFYTTSTDAQCAIDYLEKAELVREFDGSDRRPRRAQGPSANRFRTDETRAQTVGLTRSTSTARTGAAAFDAGGEVVVLEPGEWSDFVTVELQRAAARHEPTSGICRFYLRSIEPESSSTCSPINIDPENPMAPVSEPSDASADLAEAIGPYYTQGMAEDVNGAQEGRALRRRVHAPGRARLPASAATMLDDALDEYLEREDGGLFFFYFSTVDLSCHMMWRHTDAQHPMPTTPTSRQRTASWLVAAHGKHVEGHGLHELYVKMDPVLGRSASAWGTT